MGTMAPGGQLSSYMPTMMQIGQNAQLASNITTGSSLVQSQYNVNSVAEQANGLEAQLSLQAIFDKINTEVDNATTVAKNGQALAAKSLELYTLVAQTREKLMQAFSQINEQRANNAWSRINKMTQGFKLQ